MQPPVPGGWPGLHLPNVRLEWQLGPAEACLNGPSASQILIVEGGSGNIKWELDLHSGSGTPAPATLPTADHRSLFLFWGDYQPGRNGTVSARASYSSGGGAGGAACLLALPVALALPLGSSAWPEPQQASSPGLRGF